MTSSTTEANPTESLLAEVIELRREVASLRHDSAVTLKMLETLLTAVRALDRHETSIEHSINDIAKEIDDLHYDHGHIHSHCPNCGAPLEHHNATAGNLQICTACGWSQFIDRTTGALPATFPAVLPANDSLGTTPATWVE